MAMSSIFFVVLLLVMVSVLVPMIRSDLFGFGGRVLVMITTVLILGGFVSMFISPTTRAVEKARIASCMSRLASCGKAMSLYASDHDGQYPASWGSMSNYCDNPKLFWCMNNKKPCGPMTNVDVWTDYILVTNVTPTNDGSYVHAYCNPSNHIKQDGTPVLFNDSSVLFVTSDKFPSLGVDVTNLSRVATGLATGM